MLVTSTQSRALSVTTRREARRLARGVLSVTIVLSKALLAPTW